MYIFEIEQRSSNSVCHFVHHLKTVNLTKVEQTDDRQTTRLKIALDETISKLWAFVNNQYFGNMNDQLVPTSAVSKFFTNLIKWRELNGYVKLIFAFHSMLNSLGAHAFKYDKNLIYKMFEDCFQHFHPKWFKVCRNMSEVCKLFYGGFLRLIRSLTCSISLSSPSHVLRVTLNSSLSLSLGWFLILLNTGLKNIRHAAENFVIFAQNFHSQRQW